MTLRERIDGLANHVRAKIEYAQEQNNDYYAGFIAGLEDVIEQIERELKEDEKNVLVQHKQPDATL